MGEWAMRIRDAWRGMETSKKAFAAAASAWLAAWYMSTSEVVMMLLIRAHYTVDAVLFPGPLSSITAAFAVFILPVFSLWILWKLDRIGAVLIAALLCGSSAFLLFHISFFADARFLILFWAGLWLLWLAYNYDRRDANLRREAEWLVKGLAAVIFLGAGIGKWTSGYWSGDLLYHLYFVHSSDQFYPLLRAHFDPEELRSMATVFSRLVIVTESCFVFAVFLRMRHFFWAFCAMVLVIVLSTGTWFIPVILPLVGAAAAVLFLTRGEEAEGSPLSRSFWTLMVPILTLAIFVGATAFAPPVQRLWMKQFHASQENPVAWVMMQLVPKMYSMENEYPVRMEVDTEEDGAVRRSISEACPNYGLAWANHYSSALVLQTLCMDFLFDGESPFYLVMRSRYRSTCLETKFEAVAVDGDEPHLVIRLVHRSRDC